MLVFADGRTVGTIGGGCYENDAFWKAREAIATGRRPLLHYELNDDFAQENGLICGGQMDVHIDPLAPAPRLYIIGAGHVGWHLGAASPPTPASASTSSTTARSSPTRERFPGADEVDRRADRRLAAPRRPAAVGVRRGRHARPPRTTSTRCARWRRATSTTSA